MANSPVDLGTGASIALTDGTVAKLSGAELLDIQFNQTVKTINVSHMGTQNYEEYVPGDLKDYGLTLQWHFDPDDHIADDLVALGSLTATITFPLNDTLALEGFFTELDVSVPLEDKMVCTGTFMLDGSGGTVATNNVKWTAV
ncbi:MAG: hypothetical protein KJO36_03595 [Acidimicrobiia bacterium]|nr:hypothetical protein [Acidimicrobiia bacterium]